MSSRNGCKSKSKKSVHTTLGRALLPNDNKATNDLSKLRKPIDTSVFGLKQVLSLFQTATDEVRRYITYECDIMYECRICRSIFRSLANFILHKRCYCRESYCPSSVNSTNNCEENLEINCHNETELMPTKPTKRENLVSENCPKVRKKNLDVVLKELVHKQESADITKQASNENNSSILELNKNVRPKNKVALEKIPNNAAGVFQTLHGETAEKSFMKTEVMEIHGMLNANEAILGPDGKVVSLQAHKEMDGTSVPNRDLTCTICNLKFSTKKTLTHHIKYKHNVTRVVYLCPECKDTFANAWCVFRHLYKVHRKNTTQIRKLRDQIHASAIVQDRELMAKKKPIKSLEVQSVNQENQWMNDFEGDNDLQMCGGCGKRFERRAALNSHSQLCMKRLAVCNAIKENKRIEDDNSNKRKKANRVASAIIGAEKRKPSFVRKAKNYVTTSKVQCLHVETLDTNKNNLASECIDDKNTVTQTENLHKLPVSSETAGNESSLVKDNKEAQESENNASVKTCEVSNYEQNNHNNVTAMEIINKDKSVAKCEINNDKELGDMNPKNLDRPEYKKIAIEEIIFGSTSLDMPDIKENKDDNIVKKCSQNNSEDEDTLGFPSLTAFFEVECENRTCDEEISDEIKRTCDAHYINNGNENESRIHTNSKENNGQKNLCSTSKNCDDFMSQADGSKRTFESTTIDYETINNISEECTKKNYVDKNAQNIRSKTVCKKTITSDKDVFDIPDSENDLYRVVVSDAVRKYLPKKRKDISSRKEVPLVAPDPHKTQNVINLTDEPNSDFSKKSKTDDLLHSVGNDHLYVLQNETNLQPNSLTKHSGHCLIKCENLESINNTEDYKTHNLESEQNYLEVRLEKAKIGDTTQIGFINSLEDELFETVYQKDDMNDDSESLNNKNVGSELLRSCDSNNACENLGTPQNMSSENCNISDMQAVLFESCDVAENEISGEIMPNNSTNIHTKCDELKVDTNKRQFYVLDSDTSRIIQMVAKKQETDANINTSLNVTDNKFSVHSKPEILNDMHLEDYQKRGQKRRISSHEGSNPEKSTELTLDVKAEKYMDMEKLFCIPCRLSFTSRIYLMNHMSLHFRWFCFQCSKCLFMSYDKLTCIRHVTIHNVHPTMIDNIVLPIPYWKTVNLCTNFNSLKKAHDSGIYEGIVKYTDDDADRSVEASDDEKTKTNSTKIDKHDPLLRKMIMEVIFGSQTQSEDEKPTSSLGGDRTRPIRNRTKVQTLQKDFVYDMKQIDTKMKERKFRIEAKVRPIKIVKSADTNFKVVRSKNDVTYKRKKM